MADLSSMFGAPQQTGGMFGQPQQGSLAQLLMLGGNDPQMMRMLQQVLSASQPPTQAPAPMGGMPIVRPPPTGDNMAVQPPPNASNMPMVNPYGPSPQPQQGLPPQMRNLVQQPWFRQFLQQEGLTQPLGGYAWPF